tara:strand:+ start:45 stop:608 length:564 start_codon:yes stop_codon:yes gene_type:complete
MNKFKISKLKLEGTYIIETNSFTDKRGVFSRFFCKNELRDIVQDKEILNINYSKNYKKGSVRGLHFQKPPFAEIKMPRCIRGKILDIFVDIRENSKTFLNWDSIVLSEENQKMLLIPEGFAHGFQSLEDNSQILYLSTQYFFNEHEDAINIKDPLLNVELPLPIADISEKDDLHHFIDLTKFKGIKV